MNEADASPSKRPSERRDEKQDQLDEHRASHEGTHLTTDQGIKVDHTDNSLKLGSVVRP